MTTRPISRKRRRRWAKRRNTYRTPTSMPKSATASRSSQRPRASCKTMPSEATTDRWEPLVSSEFEAVDRHHHQSASPSIGTTKAKIKPTSSPSKREQPMTDAATNDVAQRFATLHEFIPAARKKLTDDKWDYMIGGAETETTLKRNRLALDSLGFRPRVLRDVSNVDCSGYLLGKKLRLPVMLAPVGSIQRFDPGGSAAVARAAGEFGASQMVSSVSEPGLEATAAAAKGMKVFQLYVRGDDDWVEDIIDRATAAGYDAFAFTVDVAIYSRREREIAKRAFMQSAADALAQRYQAEIGV